ncbi:hypothetical protein ACFQHW_08145 [Lapidilactobacillus achengensis]|uniref:Uncharacterized protein n=1 Tax=Lapidilactobacillus achengensis TaxID=2486000 RepID=A0ABW1UQQ0_9LACO|nr:hypothetical protein [Lapidilactobacillus achengensis]
MRQFGKVFVISLASLLVIGLIWFTQKDRQVVVADLAPATVQADRQAAKRVLQANITATNQGDLAAYLATIAPSKRATTEQELAPTFKQQRTQLKLRRFTVQKQTADRLVAKVDQLQTTKGQAKQQVLESNLEFTRHGEQWYIKQSILFNVVTN